ncbi:MAG TPA: hypothetical protein VFY03_00590 [Woeseiaceae bacterium]|nr:hypothetical protein [Woeseiaceae bacterium]
MEPGTTPGDFDDESLDRGDPDGGRLPAALVERLKASDRALPVLTARVDREMLAAAERQFAGRRAEPRRLPVWAGLAAALLVGLFVARPWLEPVQDSPLDGNLYTDVDGSGRVDIADVLALARARGATGKQAADLDAFARRVVALAPEGSS